MSPTNEAAPHHANATARKPAAATGKALSFLILLSASLTVIPATRPPGLTLLVVLAIPAVTSWARARKRADDTRALTSGTVMIAAGAFVLGGAFGTSSTRPQAPTPAPVTAPTSTTGLTPATVPEAVARPVVPPPAPIMVPPTTAPAVSPTVRADAATIPSVAAHVPTRAAPPATAPQRHAAPAPARSTPAEEASSGAAYYKNCTAARAAGAAPLMRGEPGYRAALDRDNDGIACET